MAGQRHEPMNILCAIPHCGTLFTGSYAKGSLRNHYYNTHKLTPAKASERLAQSIAMASSPNAKPNSRATRTRPAPPPKVRLTKVRLTDDTSTAINTTGANFVITPAPTPAVADEKEDRRIPSQDIARDAQWQEVPQWTPLGYLRTQISDLDVRIAKLQTQLNQLLEIKAALKDREAQIEAQAAKQ
jgi:hypothetical protein